jgi:hypothetical protein
VVHDDRISAAALHAMLEAPDLPELIEQGQHALANERKSREKLYEDITPEHKWECQAR